MTAGRSSAPCRRCAKGRRVAHRPVGVERQHLGVGIAPLRLPGGPDQRRRGGRGARLDQHVLAGELEPLLDLARPARRRRRPECARAGSARSAARPPPPRSSASRPAAAAVSGFSGVLSGQKRVPEPPARRTAHLIGGITGARPARADAGAGRRAAGRCRRPGCGQHREPVARCRPAPARGARRANSSTAVPESPAPGAVAEPAGVLRQRGGQRGHGFGFERAGGGVLDRQSVAAQQQRGLHAVARGETAHHIAQTGHSIALRRGEKSWRNVGVARAKSRNRRGG